MSTLPESLSSYHVRTFGCQMNLHDSEHIAGVLEEAGLSLAPSIEEADLVVFNTCCVRQSAEDRVWGNLGRISQGEAGYPVVAVCGCMAQQHGVGIIDRFRSVNLVFGIDAVQRLPDLIERCCDRAICDLGEIATARIDCLPARPASNLKAWIPVSHGCSNWCSYCVVPLVRGPERSRPSKEIIEEVERLAAEGVVEVTLLGQNVNSYGGGNDGEVEFASLLSKVAEISGVRRVKFETSHPGDLSDRILEVMGEAPSVCEHLHLPAQSGSNRVLDAMRRGYDREYFLQRIEKARDLVEGIVVTTDLMVGFPGETEKDFSDTCRLVEQAEFDSAFMFKYSPREGTKAALSDVEVPGQLKAERFRALVELQDGFTERSIKRLVGTDVELLVEGKARNGDYVVGRTRGHQVVLVDSQKARVDTLVKAEVTAAGRHAARGIPIGLPD